MTSTEKLPAIGPAKVNALTPIRSGTYYDPEWNRLSGIKVAGAGLAGDLAAQVTAAALSMSTTQIAQLSLTFADTEDAAILRSGIFRKHTSIDWFNSHLSVEGMDVQAGDGGPNLVIKSRSRVIATLDGEGHTGKGSWGTQDVGAWFSARAREAGARLICQPSLGKLLFSRTDPFDTTWAMMQRAADAVGAWCYEYENTIVFGRPTWLAAKSRARWLNLTWTANANYTDGLTGMPGYSWASGSAESLSFSLHSADADIMRPGDGVTLRGSMIPANGEWIITDVNLPLNITEPVAIGCARIKNPAPQPQGSVA